MKNPKNIIIVIVALLLVSFVAWRFVLPKVAPDAMQKGADTATDGTMVDKADAGDTVKGTLFDILNLGKSTKCVGSVDMGDGKVSTTVYASGKKSYSENIVETEDGEFKTYAVFDGEWMYSWGDMGIASKMKIDELADLNKPAEEIEEDADMAEDLAMPEDYEYKCTPWLADPSKFNPPADIEFVDWTETLKGFSEAAEKGDMDSLKESGCAACNMLQDDAAKADCMANFNCE